MDCHPDTFTAAVVRGSTPHDATRLSLHADMSLAKSPDWAAQGFTMDDLFLMEAGSNSFEVHRRLVDLGMRAVVMESCHVGKHAKSYADNDKMAAERIALVFLQGNAPCVWVPDPVTGERRELLHAYTKAHTAATNGLQGYLNQSAIRLGNATRLWRAPACGSWGNASGRRSSAISSPIISTPSPCRRRGARSSCASSPDRSPRSRACSCA